MYFIKCVWCRIKVSLNARFCKQQNKVVAVVTAVYTEKNLCLRKAILELSFRALNYTEENFSITKYFVRLTTKL